MMPARTVLTCAPRRLRVVTRYLGTQVKDKLPLKSRSPAALGRALDAVARGAPPWRPSRPAGPAAARASRADGRTVRRVPGRASRRSHACRAPATAPGPGRGPGRAGGPSAAGAGAAIIWRVDAATTTKEAYREAESVFMDADAAWPSLASDRASSHACEFGRSCVVEETCRAEV